MQTHNTILVNLILDHLHEELTPEKQEQLSALLAASPQKQQLFDNVNNPEWLQQELVQLNSIDTAAAWQKFSANLPAAPVKKMHWPKWVAAAAIVVIITGIYRYNQPPKPIPVAQSSVRPASDEATLTINDRNYALTPGNTDTLVNKDGLQVIKQDGRLWYRINSTSFNNKEVAVRNTVKTKRGYKYQLQLDDGTNVWLYPGTSISYTAPFAANERSVQVTGEAYFEVAKDSRPFRVQLQDDNGNERGRLEVLGTRFNVNAYAGAPIRTTLLEGKLEIIQGANRKTLTGGQRAFIDDSNGIRVDPTKQKVTDASRWRQNEFVFEEDPVPFVMEELARWYNFKADVRGNFKDPLSFTFSTNREIEVLLDILKKHENIQSTIKGDTIIIEPGQ